MPLESMTNLPDDSRVWIFGASRSPDVAESELLLSAVDAFLEGWRAHGAPLRAAREWRDERFLLVAVDERSVPPSGCSIDALVHVLKDVETRLGLKLVDNTPVWYRDEAGTVTRTTRAEFAGMAQRGQVSPATRVFDNTLVRLGEVRQGLWERPAADAWHGRAFARAFSEGARLTPDPSGESTAKAADPA